ncbi:hypothetical protein HDV04_000913 [Boothiomyces sp. JEL0838]|nr:hypothetical protein HDV04_000864 [Boothiomyces sp. JEL0838]KAJ3314190.1 hypothetical protein HDV04_000913 [Boothiomyces sp. JEL0838]
MPPKKKKLDTLTINSNSGTLAPSIKSTAPKPKAPIETSPKEPAPAKRLGTPKEPARKDKPASAKDRRKEIERNEANSVLKPPISRPPKDITRRESTIPKDKRQEREQRASKLFQKEDYESKKKIKKEIEAEEILEGDKPGSVAIFGKGSAKKRNKIVVEEDSPMAQDDLKIPSLWIRAGNGIVHLLEKPPDAPGVAPSAEKKKGKRKKKKLKKTDSFKDLTEGKKPTSRTRSGSSKSFFKPDSGKKTGPVYATFLINEEMLKLSTAVGVKITLEPYVAPSEDKKDSILDVLGISPSNDSIMDINAAFHSKENKIELLPQVGSKDKRKEAAPIVKRRIVLKPKPRHGLKKDTYMQHTPHPNLMSPLFPLPPIPQILYGPYQKQVEKVAEEVRKPVKYRGQEQLIFPENSFSSDPNFIERIVNLTKI